IKPVFGWEDIILPKDQMQQLRELAHHVRREQVVMGDWGFAAKLPRGRGLTTLFSGPSGTGKTMAAEVLAKELGLDLFKIDLSGVVSKYIGETEKNLNRIFTEAEDSNAILFFDEADALFGKRTEVKDAHDRYANIEVSYLLQKMEEYRGVVILATNLRKNMDEAFVRRMRFIVDFPFPDEVQREKIWAGVFPDQAPIDPGVDYRFLGRRLSLTGGNIRNISIRAAFLAAAKDQENPQIEMEEVIAATKREFQKMGRLHSDEDFHPFGRGVSKRAPQKDSTADQESPTEDRSKPE
ncbi:MAG: ATP-binding protein, partial [Acidobacteria bacterium]